MPRGGDRVEDGGREGMHMFYISSAFKICVRHVMIDTYGSGRHEPEEKLDLIPPI